ncbi:hypothetical protein HDU98_001619 [Podochytrium sp. JEL0797]|nr:hypothetical protein HDU98_001619 [Podochytrium sp. JEL0797]
MSSGTGLAGDGGFAVTRQGVLGGDGANPALALGPHSQAFNPALHHQAPLDNNNNNNNNNDNDSDDNDDNESQQGVYSASNKRKRASQAQIELLDKAFAQNPNPDSALRKDLAARCSMTPRSVQIWVSTK